MSFKKTALASIIALGLGSASGVTLAGSKVAVCHITGNGDIHMLNISAKALVKHVLNHGDYPTLVYYADNDEDGLGDPDNTADSCDMDNPPEGYVDNADDENDEDPFLPDPNMNDLVSEYQQYQDATAEDEEFEDEEEGFEDADEL